MNSWTARALAIVAAVLTVAAPLSACGGAGRGDEVVARVAGTPITAGTLAHWMALLAPAHELPDPPAFAACVAREAATTPQPDLSALKEECRQRYLAIESQALGFLISALWLKGEATTRGLAPTRAQIVAAGGTSPDTALEAEARLLEAALYAAWRRSGPVPAAPAIERYYREHLEELGRPERRYIAIVERLRSPAAARAAMKQLASRGGGAVEVIQESFDRPDFAELAASRRGIMRAIFAAPPQANVGPVPLNGMYAGFRVTRVIPGSRPPLAQVRASIEQRLVGPAQQAAAARLAADWRRRWTVATDCSSGHVVSQCPGYRSAAPQTPVQTVGNSG